MKSLGRAYGNLLLKIGLAFWLFSLCRILFYLFNSSYFPNPQLINFIGGIRFDWMTITILYSPFLIVSLVTPGSNPKIKNWLFYFSSFLAIAFNFLDFEYFKFTQKRTTFDLFTTSGLEKDLLSLVPTFIVDFWYIILLAIVSMACVRWLYKKTHKLNLTRLSKGQYVIYLFSLLIVFAIGYRGGTQLRPLNVIYASSYASAQNIPLVLNTPFTILKSSYKKGLEEKKYFSEDSLTSIYEPIQRFEKDSSSQPLNIVLVIAESFSKEYIGTYNNGIGYTPFLDSLIEHSMHFTNAYANGKKSIEALPAILSGIPTLMNTAYISSKYGSNKIKGLPTALNEKGYETVFYHGGENGTMGFHSFTQLVGVDRYVGRDQYPYKGDYDGNWGIFDEPFLQFCIEDMNRLQTPFFSGIFTLSSHHPYTIPEQHKNKFKEGKLPIHRSVSYADYSLKKFFQAAQEQEWFDNTLFIITADHTQESIEPYYNNSVGIYRIPLIFYSPKHIQPRELQIVAQQNDIYPSIMDFLEVEYEMVSFGNSLFKENNNRFSVSYLNGIYQIITERYSLQFDGEKIVAFYNIKKDPGLTYNITEFNKKERSEMKKLLKAIIQQYQTRLINNQLTVE